MTYYTLTIVTYRTGMKQEFEFKETFIRDRFLAMFINNMSNDYVLTISYGERSGVSVSRETFKQL